VTERSLSRTRGPARHERPRIDEAALEAARAADRMLAAARAVGAARWVAFFEPLPDRLRDGEIADLPRTAKRCRAAVGPNDSVADALPAEVVRPYVEAIDRLLREIARRDAS